MTHLEFHVTKVDSGKDLSTHYPWWPSPLNHHQEQPHKPQHTLGRDQPKIDFWNLYVNFFNHLFTKSLHFEDKTLRGQNLKAKKIKHNSVIILIILPFKHKLVRWTCR